MNNPDELLRDLRGDGHGKSVFDWERLFPAFDAACLSGNPPKEYREAWESEKDAEIQRLLRLAEQWIEVGRQRDNLKAQVEELETKLADPSRLTDADKAFQRMTLATQQIEELKADIERLKNSILLCSGSCGNSVRDLMADRFEDDEEAP